MSQSRKKWMILIVVGALSVLADQGTKIWARHSLPVYGHGSSPSGQCLVPEDIAAVPPLCGGQAVKVIDGFWDWRLSMNHGSAFGLFANSPVLARIFLTIVGIGAAFAMIVMMKKSRDDQTILHWALALVVGVGLMFIDIQKEKNRGKSKKAQSQERDAAARKAGLVKDLRE
jgi:lipoprotein signal peptidase